MVLGRRLSISSAADTRTVSLPAVAPLSKFAAAAVMVTVPDWTPTIRPALSTVAIRGLLLNQTNLTFGMGCESRASSSCHAVALARSEEHTSELQSPCNLVCRLLLEKK